MHSEGSKTARGIYAASVCSKAGSVLDCACGWCALSNSTTMLLCGILRAPGAHARVSTCVPQVQYKFGVDTHNMLKEAGADVTFKTYNGMAHGVSMGGCSAVAGGRCMVHAAVTAAA